MHNVICAFDDRADAERAMDSLAEHGFSREMMHLQVGYEAVASDSAAATPPVSATASAAANADAAGGPGDRALPADSSSSDAGSPSGLLQRIAGFFSDLFGADEVPADAGFYAEVIRRGGTVLVVDAVGEQEAGQARALMDSMGGTVDIDERVAQWRRGGWNGFDALRGRADPAAPPAATLPRG